MSDLLITYAGSAFNFVFLHNIYFTLSASLPTRVSHIEKQSLCSLQCNETPNVPHGHKPSDQD